SETNWSHRRSILRSNFEDQSTPIDYHINLRKPMSNIASDLYAKDQLYTFSLRRLGFLLVAIIMFVTSEYATSVYRATVYQQQIADWGLADVSGNLLGVIALNYLFLFLVHA